MAFDIIVSNRAEDHMDAFSARDRVTIFDQIGVQLSHEPNLRTRNRKPLRGNPLAGWELRVGDFRVFYDVDNERSLVNVVAVGVKLRNRLFIAGKELEL